MVATVGPSRFCEDGKALLLSSAERKGGNPGNRAPVPRGPLTTNSSFPSHRLLREPSSLLSQNPRGGNDFHAHVIPFSSVRTEQSSSGSPAGGAFYLQVICERGSGGRLLRLRFSRQYRNVSRTSRTEVIVEGNGEKKTYIRWIVAVVLIFALMGASIYGVAKKTYDDMSDAAIQNLNENLNLMRNTVEAIMRSEAEFQQLVAEEIAAAPDPSSYVLNLRNNDTTSKLSVVLAGERGRRLERRRALFPRAARLLRRRRDRGPARVAVLRQRCGHVGLHHRLSHSARGRGCRHAVRRVHLRGHRPVAAGGLLRQAGRALPSWTRPRSASCCSPRAWASVTRGT